MAFENDKEAGAIRNVSNLTSQEKDLILAFIQGAVYSWCKNRKNEWFSMRDLMGGDNYFWQGTAMIRLYKKHDPEKNGNDYAISEAGKESGWLLKQVINIDKRQFKTKKSELIRKYLWTGSENNEV